MSDTPGGPQERPWGPNVPALGVSPGGRCSGSTVACSAGPQSGPSSTNNLRVVMFTPPGDGVPVTLRISGAS